MTQPSSTGDNPPFQPAAPEPDAQTVSPATQPVVATGVQPGPVAARPKSSMWINVALGVALLVAIGGVGFAAGRMTAPATANAGGNGGRFGNGGQFPGGGYFPFGGNGAGGAGNGGGGLRGAFGGGASITGTVESVSGDTLTLKLPNGQTIQVALSGTTTYHSQTTATAGDIKTGGTVIVRVEITRGQGAEGGSSAGASANDVTIVP